MELTENEKKGLRTRLLVNGVKHYETDFFNTDSYDRLRTEMSHALPLIHDKRLKFAFCDKNDILSAGKYVIDKHFGGIDIRVPYANGDDLESQLVKRFGDKPKPEQYDEIIDYINTHLELPKVTDIPLHLNTGKSRNAQSVITWFYTYKIMEESFYKKLPICTKEINISGNCDENSKLMYVHEMSHALLNKNKGSYSMAFNKEALSIFMEKVAALDLDESGKLLELKTLFRLLQIKHNILNKELLEFREEKPLSVFDDKTYIYSALNATALFDIYKKGSKKTKREIDDAIGNVIMGNSTIEDIFDHYEATLDKGSKIMQRQIRKYSK